VAGWRDLGGMGGSRERTSPAKGSAGRATAARTRRRPAPHPPTHPAEGGQEAAPPRRRPSPPPATPPLVAATPPPRRRHVAATSPPRRRSSPLALGPQSEAPRLPQGCLGPCHPASTPAAGAQRAPLVAPSARSPRRDRLPSAALPEPRQPLHQAAPRSGSPSISRGLVILHSSGDARGGRAAAPGARSMPRRADGAERVERPRGGGRRRGEEGGARLLRRDRPRVHRPGSHGCEPFRNSGIQVSSESWVDGCGGSSDSTKVVHTGPV
jgi:hypothetical protein